jgi:Cys-tRNA(Pro)/Cys-tRNA(Cys) deacylase
MKTNAVRLLEDAKIPHRLVEYEVDESDLSAKTVAGKIRLPEEQVYKTLAVRGDKTGVILVLIPAGTELNLKALAAGSGNKSCEMLPLKEVQPVTGYIRGGVSPLGTKKPFPVYLDETALLYEEMSMSAGMRGLQVLLSPEDFVKVTAAKTGDFVQAAATDFRA